MVRRERNCNPIRSDPVGSCLTSHHLPSDVQMRLTTIGTGTAAPHATPRAERRADRGRRRPAARRLRKRRRDPDGRTGMRWQDITHVAITHFHADHTSDIATLIYAWRYGQLPPRVGSGRAHRPGRAAQAILDAMKAAFRRDTARPPAPAHGHRTARRAWIIRSRDGVVLQSFKVPHTPESVAYSVSGRGRRVVVPGTPGSTRRWPSGRRAAMSCCVSVRCRTRWPCRCT